jgi:2-polyprenyl-3-methyl-5-hydroxy-6-metoxy-1,4-benzoquinol methylase
MQTKEPQYQFLVKLQNEEGLQQFGLMSSQVWRDDPRRLGFMLARYKFVAKMFSGMRKVLEVGCADGFGARVVRQEVSVVTATDFDPIFIDQNKARNEPRWPIDFKVHNMLAGPLAQGFNGVFALDVIEHIPSESEERFVANMASSLDPHGVCIIGTPSLQSQAYASPPSKAGHVNCKDAPGLKELALRFFHNVFIFSMNDEVVHTGFYPMAHYLFALGCDRKNL